MVLWQRCFRWLDGWWRSGKDLWRDDLLREEFVIPDGVKTIWLSLHDEEGSERVEGRGYLPPASEAYPFPYVRLIGRCWIIDYGILVRVASRKLVDKTVWFQCEY